MLKDNNRYVGLYLEDDSCFAPSEVVPVSEEYVYIVLWTYDNYRYDSQYNIAAVLDSKEEAEAVAESIREDRETIAHIEKHKVLSSRNEVGV
jgi:hypothetical protein